MTNPFTSTTPATDPFRMPDGYMDDFTTRLMARIPEPEHVSVKPIRRSLWQTVRPYLSAAAVVAVVALGTKALQQNTPASGYETATQTTVANASDNTQQDELYSYLMLDDSSLYNYNNEQQ